VRRRCARLIAAAFAVCSFQAGAAGLRSFAALPLGKGSGVARVQFEHEFDADSTRAKTVVGIGLSGTQSLFLDLPFSSKRTPHLNRGDPGILYRHTLWQVDSPGATARAALLAGFVLPTDEDRDVRIRAGFVATVARRWFELDADWLWIEGTGDTGDAARYDLSWQMRVPPFSKRYLTQPYEWRLVTELDGRWAEGSTFAHQAVLGLQRVGRRWIFEGGVARDLNTTHNASLMLGGRLRF
jgi:hypothetical protein